MTRGAEGTAEGDGGDGEGNEGDGDEGDEIGDQLEGDGGEEGEGRTVKRAKRKKGRAPSKRYD